MKGAAAVGFMQAAVLILALFQWSADAALTAKRTGADDAEGSPVGKVVELLRDMAKQLEADADKEADLDEAMGCWCKKNGEERTKAITDNTAKANELQALREDLIQKSAQLNAETDHLSVEIKKNQAALDTAIALRKKENAEFVASQTDMLNTIDSLKNAQKALNMNNPKAMLQANSTMLASIRTAIMNHRTLLWDTFSSNDHKKQKTLSLILGHTSGPKAQLLQQPQSGEIMGIIDGMKESFEKNMEAERKEEAESEASHKAMREAKEAEISSGQSQFDDKTLALATADERSATTAEDLEDTRKTIAADQNFVADLKITCKNHEKEYEVRVHTRGLEIEAVNKALSFLTSDEARDVFTRSLGHAKSGEKLGSRNLDKFEEKSGKFEDAGNRGYKFGSNAAGVDFLQLASEVNSPQHKVPGGHDEAAKLAAIAQKSGAYWSAKYYMDKRTEEAKHAAAQAHWSNASLAFRHKNKEPEKRNQLGLTAQEQSVRNDAMGNIGKQMDKQILAYQRQQVDDHEKKDWCTKEIQDTERNLDVARRTKADHEEKMDLLQARMTKLEAEMKALRKEQKEQNSELGMAAHDRKKANKEYQNVIGDQQATEKLLTQALEVLKGFYNVKKAKASLIRQKARAKADTFRVSNALRRAATTVYGGDSVVQGVDLDFNTARKAAANYVKKETRQQRLRRGRALGLRMPKKGGKGPFRVVSVPSKKNPYLDMLRVGTHAGYEPPPPPPSTGFDAYTSNRQSGGVTTMLQNLISDAQAMIAEAVKGEGDALIAYEEYVADWNKATEQRNKAIVNRQMEHAKVEKSHQQEKQGFEEQEYEIARLRQYDIDLYGTEGCQFILQNYDVRYIARMEEINALKIAKVVLTGAPAPAAPEGLLAVHGKAIYNKEVPKVSVKALRKD